MGALKDWVKQDWVRIGTDGNLKEPPLQRRKRKKAQKVKPLFQIPNLQKSQKWGLGEKYLLLRLKDPSMVKLKKDL